MSYWSFKEVYVHSASSRRKRDSTFTSTMSMVGTYAGYFALSTISMLSESLRTMRKPNGLLTTYGRHPQKPPLAEVYTLLVVLAEGVSRVLVKGQGGDK